MTTLTDDFNRADAAVIGGSWTVISGAYSIVSNQLRVDTGGPSLAIQSTLATDDNSAQITVPTVGTSAGIGVICRANSTATAFYLFRYDPSITEFALYYFTGSFTKVSTFSGTIAAGDVLKIQAIGSSVKGYVNGVERCSMVDTHVTTGKFAGIRIYSSTTSRYDDFTAADASTASTSTASAGSLAWSGIQATDIKDVTNASIPGSLAWSGLRANSVQSATGASSAVGSLAWSGIRAKSVDVTSSHQRTLLVPAELRVVTTDPEPRVLVVAAESRTIGA